MNTHSKLWDSCLNYLQSLEGTKSFTSIQVEESDVSLVLWFPNKYEKQEFDSLYKEKVIDFIQAKNATKTIDTKVGSLPNITKEAVARKQEPNINDESIKLAEKNYFDGNSNLNIAYTFSNFVEGKSNQMGIAAGQQISSNPGNKSYNPLFLYGGTGLGKTHLLHAIGNDLIAQNPNAKLKYITSEHFVQDMVTSLRNGTIDNFKMRYRNLDALLIDDIQFMAGKEHSQEEFFHAFNALLESDKQIIVTSDCYHKELTVEDRLKSRLGWGLSLAIEPPDLETRVAILKNKARVQNVDLPDAISFFIAKRLKTNVRELEGLLNKLITFSNLKNTPITLDFTKETLSDVFATHDRLISIDNIQKTVAEYFKIKVADINSKTRKKSIARPRQIAMKLCRELTKHSYPEIGDAFGGRDHTTVIHAVKKIDELKLNDRDVKEDYSNIYNALMA